MWVINTAVGCHYFPPGLQLLMQPLRGLLPILLLGEHRQNGCEQFVARQRHDCNMNPGPSAPESSKLTTPLPSHPVFIAIRDQKTKNWFWIPIFRFHSLSHKNKYKSIQAAKEHQIIFANMPNISVDISPQKCLILETTLSIHRTLAMYTGTHQ